MHRLNADPLRAHLFHDSICDFVAPNVGVFLFVIVARKSIKADHMIFQLLAIPAQNFFSAVLLIYQIRVFCSIDLNLTGLLGLPVCGEDNDGCRFHFRCDLLTNLFEFPIGRVIMLVHDIGLSVLIN